MNTSLKIYKRISVLVELTLIVFVAVLSIKAQTSGVDLSFSTIPEKDSTSAVDFILQPDNKIIIFGDFPIVNGVNKNRLARLNTDGSLDNTFTCTICDFAVFSAAAQPDGKIVIAGYASSGGGGIVSQPRIYRLNADGSRDESFNSPFPEVVFPASASLSVRAIQSDGKILVVYTARSGSAYGYTLYRLNQNGTVDNTFTTINLGGGSGGTFGSSPSLKILALPNGNIYAAVNSFANCPGCTPGTATLKRYNGDGSADTSFESPVATVVNNFDGSAAIADFDVQPDGSVIIVGRFAGVNGLSRSSVAKILPAGNVDLSFNSSDFGLVEKVKVLPDGKILIGKNNRLYRLNGNGSTDNTFNAPANLTQIINWTLDSAGRIFLYGAFLENGSTVRRFARLNQDGSVENSFTVNFGLVASVTEVAAQTDGKVIFAGDFIRVNGTPRVSITRVNADGSLDTTFNSGSGFDNNTVSKILVQADGKILVGGSFSNYNGTPRRAFARLNTDGSLDTAFNQNITSGQVNTIALQADGKILVGGTFINVGGQDRAGIARLNADGSLDASFNPVLGSPSINSIVVQPDGKIMVGGNYSGVNGFSRQNLARLNADGSLDASFNAGTTLGGASRIAVLSDGKYLISYNNTVFRLNNSGTRDTAFASPTFNGQIAPLVVLPDGSILVSGIFTTVNGVSHPNFARLKSNGALDNNFIPSGANGAVRTIFRQDDGRILIGGDFSIVGGVTRLNVARLNVAPYRLITPYDYDGDSRADLTVFRPSNGYWYELNTQNNAFYAVQFGQSGDKSAPADYDGDGKTDIAVFRDVVPGAGNFAYFYILNSSDNSFRFGQFGATGDVPMAGDWDGDGKADLAVYRNGTAGGQSYFYYRPSSQPTVNYYTLPLGIEGDKPVLGDFDGDGRLDPAVFYSRSSQNAFWLILQSSVNQVVTVSFGSSSDIPVPADYDGDGKTNIAVFRPSNGTWFTSTNAQNNYGAVQFGASEDLPIPADYDGDGRADVAVFRPSTGAWYLNRSTQGFTSVQFGQSGDKPSPNAFIR